MAALRPMSVLLLVSVVALAAASCGDDPEPSPGDSPSAAAPPEQSSPPAPPDSPKQGPLHFVDRAYESGLHFRVKAGTADKMWIVETMGQGVMLFDYDNDGDLDAYLANGGEIREPKTGRVFHNGLFRNDGGWRFTNVTEGSGLELPEWSVGVYHVDFDGDGFDDVYVTQFGRNRIFRNLEGTGRFEDVTDRVGGDTDGYSTSAAFFDADNDGDLDLYVCNYVLFDPERPPNEGLPCPWRNILVCCGPRGLTEAQDRFYELVDGRYVDRTKEWGFEVVDSRGRVKGSYSLGVVTGDFDGDGDYDVYVAVDSRPNLMFVNRGKGRFEEVAQDWQTALNSNAVEQAGMGVSAGDMNGDGKDDFFVTNFSHDSNTLYINAGEPDNMFYEDLTRQAALAGDASFPFLSWGLGLHDFNCDGRRDILVVSGHVYPQAEGVIDLGTTYAQPNQLFMATDRPLRFREAAAETGGALARAQVSRGTSFGDIDRDGRIDVLVTNLDDWANVYRNECDVAGGWIGFYVRTKSAFNRHGIGTRIALTCKGGRRHVAEIHGGGGYLGANEPLLHFGLAGGEVPEKLEVSWPDREKETIAAPPAGAYYRIVQGSGTAAVVAAPD